MRLITRADFDGSVCAALLLEVGLVEEILYAHPNDLQENRIPVGAGDILANVPYVAGCAMWFDHHSSERERLSLQGGFAGLSADAPSAAQVVFDYFRDRPPHGGRLARHAPLVAMAGVVDSGRFSRQDVLDPQGYVMLAFISDPRTGLGRRRSFRISNLELMKRLPQLLRTRSVDEILALPDFRERADFYAAENARYRRLLLERSRAEGDALLIDLRGVEEMPVGNRFLEYVIFPEQNISIRVADGRMRRCAMISVGHNIFNRSCRLDVGALMLRYGGGGHARVGACQVGYADVGRVVAELLQAVRSAADRAAAPPPREAIRRA
ncbi:MAG: exopolyphosphatase [Desulfobacterales bacterium]|nr:exopolyphosphatase [Desulfobacterales bacterium]